MNNFGEYLRAIRKASGLSMAVLAEQSGVSQPYISQIERGERGPSPEILKKLASALGTNYSELMLKAGYVPEELAQKIDQLTLLKGLHSEYQQATKRVEQADKELEAARAERKAAEHDLSWLEEMGRVTELMEFLSKSDITYKGKVLSDHDKQRIAGVVEFLFAEREG
ncbi:helix-turn-helix transcriptional regulator [Paenibacillus sp. GCM10012307]